MRARTTRCLATGSLWVVLFMSTRIRVKLNGTDVGKALLVQDGLKREVWRGRRGD